MDGSGTRADGALTVDELPEGERMLRLEGVLDFDSVPRLSTESCGIFEGQRRVVVDMHGVTHSNSAGLALLIEWKRLSDTAGSAMEVRGLPDTLRNIARLCELEPLLPARSD